MYQKNGHGMAFHSELHILRQIPNVPHWELSKKQSGLENSQSTAMEAVATHLSRMDVVNASGTILDALPNDVEESSYCPSGASDTETMSVDDGEEEFTRVALLPPGGMDVETKKRILASQRKTPRYLFRGWCNAKGNASGGYPKLNTANGITLRAFCFDGLSHTTTLRHCMISPTTNFNEQTSQPAALLDPVFFVGIIAPSGHILWGPDLVECLQQVSHKHCRY
jgi:hypothetical protein